MKTTSSFSQRGSAFITTLGFCVLMLLLIGSILKYSTQERRLNNRAKLLLETRTAAEALSEYGIAQVKNLLESNRTFTDSTWSSSDEDSFTPGGKYDGSIGLPPDGSTNNFWGGGNIVTSAGASAEKPLIRIGKIKQLSNDGGSSGLFYIDPTIPDNESDPLKGKRVFRYDLDVVTRATAKDTFSGGSLTNFMKQTFSVRAVPLFSNAVYYNMDMEVQPGPNMTITGSTHTNGRLFARSASSSPTYVTFAGPVTAVKGIWTNFHTTSGDNLMPYFQSITETGSLQTNATTGLVNILPLGATVAKPMRLTADTVGFSPNLLNGTWVESTWDLHPSGETWQRHLGDATPYTETTASKKNFADWIQQTFKGNLLTNVNGLQPNNIPGIPDYKYTYGSLYPDPNAGTSDAAYTYGSGGNDIDNSAHALIETPRLSTAASYNEKTEDIKYSRYASLYIAANTTAADATGHKPDGTEITVPARSYRAFMNDTTTSPYTITEVILPGQNTFGDTVTANPYTAHRDARPIVQMVDIDYTTNIEKATQRRMMDMRRTKKFDQTAARSSSNPYDPKNLYMIDIDMTELKKAVKTISVPVGSTGTESGFYLTGVPPAASADFNHYIYKETATTTDVTLSNDTRIITTDKVTLTNAFTSAIWNGAVYVESIAADYFDTAGADAAARRRNTHVGRNSGVRLINGRGKVPSLDETNLVGFTFVTNDAVYVLGTFNADGDDDTPATVSVNIPPSPGASTGHNYEAGELPASIVADAVYLLSQPRYTSATTQASGWNDAFSGYAENADSNWNSGWATKPPSSSNRRDGDKPGTTTAAYLVPYDSSSGDGAKKSSQKLDTYFTEYSFAMLCGLVPTGKNGITQTSGGLHNFPRFLEKWSGVECRIRGAMVALFECRVANDTWSLRVYDPPNRIWGFNLLFGEGHMPPLTPKTIVLRRIGANDITKVEFNAKMTAWGYATMP